MTLPYLWAEKKTKTETKTKQNKYTTLIPHRIDLILQRVPCLFPH